jgi:hypothetical protein
VGVSGVCPENQATPPLTAITAAEIAATAPAEIPLVLCWLFIYKTYWIQNGNSSKIISLFIKVIS